MTCADDNKNCRKLLKMCKLTQYGVKQNITSTEQNKIKNLAN